MQPYTRTIPTNSLIENALQRVDYQDSYGIKTAAEVPLESLPALFFQAVPRWAGKLMAVREAIAGLIGLKTARHLDVQKQVREFTGKPGDSIGLFHVLDRTDQEILTGENDRHLDFRLSFFALPVDGGTEVILTTTVQFNALLGRLYFLPVQPIHRIIVPSLLRRMAKALAEKR